MIRSLALSTCLLLLSGLGCVTAGTSVRPDAPGYLAKAANEGVALRDPLELSEALKKRMRYEVGSYGTAPDRAHRLRLWLNDVEANFAYSELGTYTAQEAFDAHRGDCFAFTNMFIAMARELSVPVSYTYVREIEGFHERKDLFVVSLHVAATYFDGTEDVIVDFQRKPEHDLLYTYRRIPDDEAVALFNSNLAIENLIRGQSVIAESKLRFLTREVPELPELYANLAAVLLRRDKPQEALQAVDDGLKAGQDFPALYTNGIGAALELGDRERARSYEQLGAKRAENDPLFTFSRGLESYARGDYVLAARHFERVVQLQRDSPMAWVWLVRARFSAGQSQRGAQDLAQALHLVPDDPQLRQLRIQHPEQADQRL
jgi:tetratricopeptide (TPR) repeat protein